MRMILLRSNASLPQTTVSPTTAIPAHLRFSPPLRTATSELAAVTLGGGVGDPGFAPATSGAPELNVVALNSIFTTCVLGHCHGLVSTPFAVRKRPVSFTIVRSSWSIWPKIVKLSVVVTESAQMGDAAPRTTCKNHFIICSSLRKSRTLWCCRIRAKRGRW